MNIDPNKPVLAEHKWIRKDCPPIITVGAFASKGAAEEAAILWVLADHSAPAYALTDIVTRCLRNLNPEELPLLRLDYSRSS